MLQEIPSLFQNSIQNQDYENKSPEREIGGNSPTLTFEMLFSKKFIVLLSTTTNGTWT
jgi:hypothetical protein